MLKKAILSILLVVLSLGIFSVVASADTGNYFFVSYGSNDKDEKVSISMGVRFTNSILEYGFISKNDKASTSDFDFGTCRFQ